MKSEPGLSFDDYVYGNRKLLICSLHCGFAARIFKFSCCNADRQVVVGLMGGGIKVLFLHLPLDRLKFAFAYDR